MRKLILTLIALVTATTLPAQDRQRDDASTGGRKRVAVVLSGGGAKGMAHIGALKVIERAGLPVDIITGTSMGSLVGGLYAIGYNADMLDSIVRVQDWSYVITDRENLKEQSLADRRKQNTYVMQRGLTIGKRTQSDGGFITGKNLAVLFQKLCYGYTDSMDFRRLPIPFACVATDIVTNTEHDFFSGRLPQAMRASMAIPAVFSPVRIGDEVLVDGGMRNNYPADLARQMGADIIIGVTVQEKPKTAAQLSGTMSIIGQIVDVNTMNKYDDNLAITDVPIRVNPGPFSTASFTPTAVDSLIKMGEAEAMTHWDELVALRSQIGLPDDFRPRRLSPLRPSVMTERVKLVGVSFENMSAHDEQFLTRKFRLNQLDSIDTAGEERITTSMRIDLFYQNAEARTTAEGDGYRLILTAGNRKTTEVGVGFRFDNEEMVALQLNADLPLHTTIPTDVDLTLRLGKRLMARADLTFHPSSSTRPVLSYAFRHNDIDVYHDGERDYSLLYNHHQAELLPVNFSVRNFNVRMGVRWDYYHFNDKLISEHAAVSDFDNSHYFSYRAQVSFNSEDDWYFPARGARFNAAYAYVTDNFARLDGKAGMSDVSASWRKSFPLGTRFTLQPMLYGRLLFGAHIPSLLGNVAGGEWFAHYLEQQMPFAGQDHFSEAERHFVAVQLQAQQRILTNHFVQLRVAAAQQAHDIGNLLDHSTTLGIQGAYFYRTMFGPLGATVGYSNISKKPSFYINLGYEF